MNKFYITVSIVLLCAALAACDGGDGGRAPIVTKETDRTAAVIEIAETEHSKIDIPVTSATTVTARPEVIVTEATTARTTKATDTEPPKEYYTVKFVNSDGYTSVSFQTVIEGGSAVAPEMPQTNDEGVFRGWDKDFSDVHKSMIVRAIYQKEVLTVNFFDWDGTLLKTEQVNWGEDATAPEVSDRGSKLFDGWSVLFNDVRTDLNIFAIYYTDKK